MSRPTVIAALVVLVIGALGFAGWRVYRTHAAEEARELRERRRDDQRRAREQETEQLAAQLRAGSEDKFPPPLEGVALGMTEAEVRALRPNIQLKVDRAPGPGEWFEERLSNGAQALYAFGDETGLLGQVQVLSLMPPEGMGPHLTALVERYGSPSGVWHCPATGRAGVPTRRFTWRMADVSIQDVILVHPGGVSVTLYIAPSEVIGQSLRLSSCRPVRDREEMADLPIARPEQLRDSPAP